MRKRTALPILFALAAPLLSSGPSLAAPSLKSPDRAATVHDGPTPAAGNPVITLAVDATDAPRKILHVRETFPVQPGPLTLLYPKWIPGEHRPSGPLVNLAGPILTANGQRVAWRRDLVDLYALHCTVPPGAHTLDAAFDFLAVSDNLGTPNLAVLNWNQVLLYPDGRTADGWTFDASLRLPPDWKFGTALPVAALNGDTVHFQPAPLVTLIDSPVNCGRYFQVVPLTPPSSPTADETGTGGAEIDLVADSPTALEMPPDMVRECRQLVTQANALFGARHYRDYHWLLTLSDRTPGTGVEHHESSDDRTREKALSTPMGRADVGGLLAHEYTHSWNGKYRRPYDLYTPDYQAPMQDDLLWVYEGMTQYWGVMLNERAGLEAAADTRDDIANIAAGLDYRPGRAWRALQDTADASSFIRGTGREYDGVRRGQDYYNEGLLIWLEADTRIRRQTQGKRSLDDFCRAFFGPPNTAPQVRTYTFDDIVQTLNAVAPGDWAGFLRARLDAVGGGAPLGGITNSGWRLVYTDVQSPSDKYFEGQLKTLSLRYSLGLTLDADGVIQDINPALPAYAAGLGPGMKIVAVNDQAYTPASLHAALKAAVSDPKPLSLLVSYGATFHTYAVDYHGGDRYPHLQRDSSQPDLLSAIFAPKG